MSGVGSGCRAWQAHIPPRAARPPSAVESRRRRPARRESAPGRTRTRSPSTACAQFSLEKGGEIGLAAADPRLRSPAGGSRATSRPRHHDEPEQGRRTAAASPAAMPLRRLPARSAWLQECALESSRIAPTAGPQPVHELPCHGRATSATAASASPPRLSAIVSSSIDRRSAAVSAIASTRVAAAADRLRRARVRCASASGSADVGGLIRLQVAVRHP